MVTKLPRLRAKIDKFVKPRKDFALQATIKDLIGCYVGFMHDDVVKTLVINELLVRVVTLINSMEDGERNTQALFDRFIQPIGKVTETE